MNRRQVLPMFGLPALGLPLLLAGCGGRSESYRYKLTLAVDTPDGVKTAFNVVQVYATQSSQFWGGGAGGTVRGEALYLDLGQGARPLIAVMALSQSQQRKGMRWTEGAPDDEFLLRLYGDSEKVKYIDRIERLKRHRGPRAITSADLPDLITFANINDPKSVLAVDPNNLSSALGRNVRWRSITIEVTDESITNVIEQKLPWLKGMSTFLDGSRTSHSNNLANQLTANAFRKG